MTISSLNVQITNQMGEASEFYYVKPKMHEASG